MGRRWLLVGLLFLWLAATLATYYVVQNAFLRPTLDRLATMTWLPLQVSAGALVRLLMDLLVAAWMAFVALGLGRGLLSRLSLPDRSGLEELLLALGVGLGGLGLLTLFLGLVGWLWRPLILALTVALTLVTARPSLRFLRGLPRPAAPGPLAGAFLAGTFFLALTLALLPPTSWDGLFYHLTGPRLAIEAGALNLPAEVPHFRFPALMEMIFTYTMLLRGDVSAVLMHFLYGLMVVGLVYLMARRLFGLDRPWTAVLLLLAVPMVPTLAGWAYNDLALAFYEVAALYALLRWRQASASEQDSVGYLAGAGRWLVLTAIFSGLAMGLKYTSFVAPLAMALLIIWWLRDRSRQALRATLAFGALAMLVALPWYGRNLLATGNPVYPFFFGGAGWDDFRADAYAEAGTGIAFDPESCTEADSPFLVGQNPSNCDFDGLYLLRRLATLPLDMTLGLADASRDGLTGPLFLVFLPVLVVYAFFSPGRRSPLAFGPLIFFGLGHYLFWTTGVVYSAGLFQTRLLLPALIALCPAMAWMLEDLGRYDHPRFSLSGLLKLVVGIVLLVGLLIQTATWLPEQPWAYLGGSESRPDYLARRLGAHFAAMEAVNDQLPLEGRVKLLWEPRSYYCRADCLPDSILDAFGHAQYLYGDAAVIAQAWREEGISHVLLFHTGLDFVRQANSPDEKPLPVPQVLTDLLEERLEPVTSVAGGAYRLYRLKP